MYTFKKAQEFLGNRQKKKLAHNTTIRLEDGLVKIRYHNTDIVTITADDVYTLNNGGWSTPTTKTRLNKFSPARIYQQDYCWYIKAGDKSLPFNNYSKVDVNGILLA
jgi:ATP-dependent RNA circularization protein (DNA/RNA ligase family)